MPQCYTPPKNFGNLLPQVNFQIPLQVNLGTLLPLLDHGLRLVKWIK